MHDDEHNAGDTRSGEDGAKGSAETDPPANRQGVEGPEGGDSGTSASGAAGSGAEDSASDLSGTAPVPEIPAASVPPATPESPLRPVEESVAPLAPDLLRWRCDPDSFGFERVDELERRDGIIGQDRAVAALELGITLRNKGYNVFVTGPSGSGRTTTVKHVLETTETDRGAPSDIVIINNFRDPDRPRSIFLPAGDGSRFAREMRDFVEVLRRTMSQLYQAEGYKERRKQVIEKFQEEEKAAITAFEAEVKKDNFALVQIQVGPINRPEVAPLIAGEPVQIERLQVLTNEGKFAPEELARLQEKYARLRGRLEETFRKSRSIQRRLKAALGELEREFARPILGEALGDIREDFPDTQIDAYLREVEENILARLRVFLEDETEDEHPELPLEDDDRFRPYLVNVLVDNSGVERPPVVVETSPNYRALFGTIEKTLDRTGVWKSDFHHIKAGSVLRANGGYLVLHLTDMITEGGVWQALIRTLKNRHIDIQSFDPFFLVSSSAIKPEPIAVDVRVIVIGTPYAHNVLSAYDPDFRSVFKVKADFDSVISRDAENLARYAAFIGNVVASESLRPLDKSGVARVCEYGARLAGHGRKLSTHFSEIADVLRESTYWARKAGSEVVRAEHVGEAVRQKEVRVALPEEKLQEAIMAGLIHVETTGAVIGQVNGLSVYDLGDHRFGKPVRISAQTALGSSGIVNIEREADLAGRSFNKAILILDGFFRARFGQEQPVSMFASIAFEQSYGEVDGDSASVAEVCAILSSLAEIPVRQDVAITGSVDQYGRVQAIGGANEKVEGFFDVCRERGLSGTQGVAIPATNVPDLMLREEIVTAAQDGKFAIWPIARVEEAVRLLLGVPAGERGEDGEFPEGTVYRRVEDKLFDFAERMKEFGKDVGENDESHPASARTKTEPPEDDGSEVRKRPG